MRCLLIDLDQLVPQSYGSRTEYLYDGARIIFDQVTNGSRGIGAWIEIRWQGNTPPPALMHYGTYNLTGARTVTSLASSIPDAFRTIDIPWLELFTTIVYDMVRRELEGAEPIRLADVEPLDRPTWILPYLVPGSAATSLIAVGGSMKSLLALAIACTVASGSTHFLGMKPKVTGPVLYLDLEDDEHEHARRMRAMCGTEKAPEELLYFRQAAPLARVADSLAKRADELDAALLIVDSVMLARGGEANYAEPTLAFYSALRQIGRPAVLVDHKSREAARKGWKGAYGSVVNDNTRRLTWEITGPQPTLDGQVIRLDQGKTNNFGKLPPLGFRIVIESDEDRVMTSCRIRQTAPHTITSFNPEASLVDLIADYLAEEHEPQPVRQIAETLEATEGTVRKILSRYTDRFVNVAETGKGMWRIVGQPRDDGEALPVPF